MRSNRASEAALRTHAHTQPRALRVLVCLLVFAAFCAGEFAPPVLAQAEGSSVVAQKGGKKHRKRKKRPIALGVSGGNVLDFVLDPPFILCAGGTLGALIEKNDEQYILSNNHVLARSNAGKKGDPITQPALLDQRCNAGEQDIVANLSSFKRIKPRGSNKVDMALAQVQEGMVDENGKILRIGIPGNEAASPGLGMRVKKAGRTTGITKGEVVVLETVVNVDFSSAGVTHIAGPVRFKNQMIITGLTGEFSAGGDSGSVIYEDVASCPRAVGLLFAGGVGFTAANHMDTVLKVAGKLKPKGEATLVGCTPTTAMTALAGGSGPIHRLGGFDRSEMLAARRAREIHEDAMLSIRGVVGLGIGANSEDPRRATLKVLVEKATPELLEGIPTYLEGVPTEVLVTGRFRAF